MNAIKALPASIWNYISPVRQKKQTTTRSHSRTPLQSPRQSPNLLTTPSGRRPSSQKSDVKRSRSRSSVSTSTTSPSDHPAKRRKVLEEKDNVSVATPANESNPSGSQEDEDVFDDNDTSKSEYDKSTTEWDNALDEHDESLIAVKPQGYSPPSAAAFEKEYSRREDEAAALASAGWVPADVQIFRKLAMRGFEPLMPYEWCEKDLSALPTALFTEDDEEAFIKGICKDGSTTSFHAVRHFTQLLDLGARVRAKQLSKRNPGSWIKHEIKAYYKWALKDAALYDKLGWPAILVIQVASSESRGHELQSRMIKRLRKVSQKWSKTIKRLPKDEKFEIPSVYGVIISQTVIAFVTYVAAEDIGSKSAAEPTSALHTIGLFDFSDGGYDVWNAIALAIFAVHCRNQLMDITELAPSIIRGDRPASPDPDL